MKIKTLTLLLAALALVSCGDKDAGLEDTDTGSGTEVDSDDDGYLPSVDCDDGDPSVHPGADEICDGIDNDCDGSVDLDAIDAQTWYADEDGDGFGDTEQAATACDQPDRYVSTAGDCDDADAAVHPAADELCNGVDDNCDELLDGDDAIDRVDWHRDADDDGYGDVDDSLTACEQPEGYVSADAGVDCDDTRAEVNPGLAPEETCADGLDNDCDGLPDAKDTDCPTTVHPGGGTMVWLDAGTFDMGCTPGVESCDDDENPVFTVTLTHGFHVGATEVTQGQFEALMGTNPSYNVDCGLDCPVDNLTWHMAAAYANAASAAEGLDSCYDCTGAGSAITCVETGSPYDCEGYRLPTEAEWEYAARCGEDLLYSGSATAADVAWYGATGTSHPQPVGTKAPNACDIYDMSGNVYEWGHDWYESALYRDGVATDPEGAAGSGYRVLRGGCWYDLWRYIRVSDRAWDSPSYAYSNKGMRLVKSLP